MLDDTGVAVISRYINVTVMFCYLEPLIDSDYVLALNIIWNVVLTW